MVFLFLFLLFSQPVYSEGCRDDLIKLRSFDLEVFSDYSQAALIRDDALLLLYSSERTECNQEILDFNKLVISYLTKFNTAYRNAISGNSEVALETEISMEKEIMEMKRLSKNLGDIAREIVMAAEESRTAFLEDLAIDHENKAENSLSTREKLRNYDIAIKAYESSDNYIEASGIKVKRDIINNKYIKDMKEAENYEVKAINSLKEAESAENIIDAYIKVRESKINFEKAALLYERHSENSKISLVNRGIEKCNSILSKTRNRILVTYILLSIIVTLISLYTLNIILRWNGDSYDCYLGNELLKADKSED